LYKSQSIMPKLIGSSKTVVKTEDGLQIDELAGNVATSDDTISIAYVTVSEPTSEPWLTLDYDEWLCVRRGKLVLHYYENGSQKMVEVNEGETCLVAKGERFKPEFPVAPTEYIPVCLPAFRPDRCLREEEGEESDVTVKLMEYHGMNKSNKEKEVLSCSSSGLPGSDSLFHMCQKTLWEEASASGNAYYPPTFEEDGHFTHATAVPERLIETANHFYTDVSGDWICLELSRSALRNLGIITKDEGSLPVGETSVSDDWTKNNWVCPHIYGGIPTNEELHVLQNIYPMKRNDDGTFINIEGLTK